jgi:hypothetical protein
MQSESKVQIPIPRVYWDAMQASLNAEVKRLSKEISRVLHQPEHPLLRAVKENTIGMYIFEEEGSELVDIQSMRCSFMIPSEENPAVLCRCNQPILLGAGNACPSHLQKESPRPDVQRLKIIKSFEETYWVDQENIIRRKGDLKPIGKYNADTRKCILFQIE